MGTGTGKILEKTVPLVKGIDRGTVQKGGELFFRRYNDKTTDTNALIITLVMGRKNDPVTAALFRRK